MPETNDEKNKDKPEADHAKDIADLKAANAALLARLDKLTAKPDTKDDEKSDDDLSEKVKKQNAEKDQKNLDSKALESALTFTLKSEEFLKSNQSLLPKDVVDIFKAADKEKFDSAVDKSNAIKSGIVKSFFSLQSNLDLLTGGQKSILEEYLKLTNTAREERAQEVYQNILEPSLNMLRNIKRAEEIGKVKNGLGASTDADKAYKEKMMAGSKKHYMGEKTNGA